jgi:hypothetical protein
VDYVLKAINRLGWSRYLENHAKSGVAKAYVLYLLSDYALMVYEDFLEDFQHHIRCAPQAKQFAQKLKDSQLFTLGCEDFQFAEMEELKALSALDQSWLDQVSASLGDRLEKIRLNPDSYIFRTHWPQLFQKEVQSGMPPRFSKALREWFYSHGWEFGIETANYYALNARCGREDSRVDRAYRKFGFGDFEAFLRTKPAAGSSYQQALEDCVLSHVRGSLVRMDWMPYELAANKRLSALSQMNSFTQLIIAFNYRLGEPPGIKPTKNYRTEIREACRRVRTFFAHILATVRTPARITIREVRPILEQLFRCQKYPGNREGSAPL